MATGSVSVWWDVDACPVPRDLSPEDVIENVNRFLEMKGIHEAWSMNIFGSDFRVNLASSLVPNVKLHQYPPGEPRIHEAILFWALDARPPATVLLAAALTPDVSRVLMGLQHRGFRVIHAYPSAVSVESLKKSSSKPHNPADLPDVEAVDWEYVSAGFSSPDKLSLSKHPLIDVTPRKLLQYVMQSLEYDKLLPSNFNVQARLRYVMAKQGLKDIPGWSSWKFVERALAAGEIKVMSEECNDVYLPKGRDICWPWIDPSFPCNVYEDSIWLAFQKYLLAEGRWAMESSKSSPFCGLNSLPAPLADFSCFLAFSLTFYRYHAAETLKIEGPQELRQLVMGQLIHVVQLSVTLRGWLKPHPTKWTPVQVTVHEPSPLLQPGALLLRKSLLMARVSSTKTSGYSAGASAHPGRAVASASPTRLSPAAIAAIVSRPGLPLRNLLGRELAEVKPESPHAGSPRLRQGTDHGEETDFQGAWEQGRERGRAQQWDQRHEASGMGEREVPVVLVKPWDDVLKVPASPSEGLAGEEGTATWEDERPRGSWRSTPRSAAASAAAADVLESPVSSPSPMSWRRRQKLQEFRDFAARVLLNQPHGIQLDQLQKECARKMPRGFNSEALGFASLRDVLESMKDLARLEAFPGGFVLVFASDELKGTNLEGCSSPLARAVSASPSAARSAASSDPVSALPSPTPGFSSHPPLAAAGPVAVASSSSTPSSALHPSTPTTPRASPPPVPKPRPEGYRRFDTSWGGESSSPFSPRSSPHSSSLRYREPPSSESKFAKERALGPSFSSPLSPFTGLPSPRSLDASPSSRPPGVFNAHQRRPSGLGEEPFGSKGGNQLWDEGMGWGEGKGGAVDGGLMEGSAALGSPSGSRWRTEGRWREVREVCEVREVEEVRGEVRDEVMERKQKASVAVHPEAGPFMQPASFSPSSTSTSDSSGPSSILETPSSVSDAGVSKLRSRAVPPPCLELPLATIAAENVTESSKGNLTESSRSAKATGPAKGRAADGGKARASHKAELMRSDLRQLLQEVLSKPGVHKTGYQLAFLKGAFLQKYAYPLDHTVLGYPKLKALLLSMEDVVHVAAAPGGHGVSEAGVQSADSSVKEVVKAATHWQVKVQHGGKAKVAAPLPAAPSVALSPTIPTSSPLSTCSPEDELSVSALEPGSLVHEQPMEQSPIMEEGTPERDEGSPEVAALVLASLEQKREDSAPKTHADEDDDARERAMEAASPDIAARLVPCANAAKSPEPGARESIQSMWDEELSRAKCAVHGGDCQGRDDGCAPALKELSGGGPSGDSSAGRSGSVGVPRGVQQLLNEAFSAIPVSSFPLPPGGEVVEIASDASILEAVRILSVHRILSAPVRNARLTGTAAGGAEPGGAREGGAAGGGGAGGAGLGLGPEVAWSDRYLGMVDYAGVMMWVLQQADLAAATLAAGTATLTGVGVGVVGALGAAALGVGGAPLAVTGVAAAAVGAAVAGGLRERRKLGGGRGGGAAAAADSLGVDFFHMITENEPFKSATVADITRSYRWAPFLPLQPTDSMLTLLLLLSRFRMRSVPVVALGLAPPAPRLHNLITQSAVVRGLARCRGFDWFDVIADKPLMTLGLPLVGEEEVVSVDTGALVLEAFLLMKEKGVGGVPVTDGPDRILYANISARDVGLLLLHPDMFHSRSHLTVRDFVDRCLALQAADLHVPPASSSLTAADLSSTTSTTPTPTDATVGVSGTSITTTIPLASTALGAIGKTGSNASDSGSGDSYGLVGSMRPAVSCRRTDSLVSVIETLAGKGIHRVYVTDDHDRLQGVVTLRDIISRFVTEPEGYFDNFLGDMARAWK
ncbi:unnamed protein product [Closterium sp. Yama58-4]|nr:unnamed protein product [Closterium sp. Yama58-4]